MGQAPRFTSTLDDGFNRIVAHMYDAAGHPELWPDCMRSLAELLGSSSAHVHMHDETESQASIIVSAGVNLDYERPFNERYLRNSPCLLAARRGELVNFSFDELEHTEIYNDFFRPQDIFHGICGRIFLSNKQAWCFVTSRPRKRAPFSQVELKLLGLLLPHLRSALSLQRRIQEAVASAASAEATLDLLTHGTILLDTRQQLVRANRAAQDILDRRDGLFLDRTGMLCASDPQESGTLRRLLTQAVQGPGTGAGGTLAVARPSKQQPLCVSVAPLDRRRDPFAAPGSAAAVFISDPQCSLQNDQTHWRALYGLTQAEARVAMQLTLGESPSQIADGLRVSMPTIRTHLQRLYQRTGTRGQGDLIRLLLKVPPIRRNDVSQASPWALTRR